MNEEKLKNAASEAARRMLDTLPEDCAHDFSPRFQRKMRALLRREEHPVIHKTLLRVASLAAMLIICFAVIRPLLPVAHSEKTGWILKETDKEIIYHFYGEYAYKDRIRFEPTWIPDSCQFVERTEMQDGYSVSYVYTDPKDDYLIVEYYSGAEGITVGYDFEPGLKKTVSINGVDATMYLPQKPDSAILIIWEDPDRGYLFIVNGNLSEAEMIKIAENFLEIK